jgi:hypothetical protein
VLATAVVDDPELRRAFPDGIAWLVFGRSMAGAGSIKPSPTGVPPAPAGDHKGHGEERIAWTGKISAIVYDQFGDFEGFRLATEDGERLMTARRSVPCLSRLPDRLRRCRIDRTCRRGPHLFETSPEAEEVRFATDSPVEGAGFVPSVP